MNPGGAEVRREAAPMRFSLLFVLPVVFATPALAVDGVLEINQTCAKQTGCFSGDSPGYPVTITGAAGRSYKLTSDIGGVIGLNTNAIAISANDITIDLAGFRIICTTFTPPFTVDLCSDSGSGSGSGIAVDDVTLRSGVRAYNGSVVGMPGSCVYLGSQSTVHNLRASQCGFAGINVWEGSIISGSTADGNGQFGILSRPGSTVSGNTAYENKLWGISAGAGSTVSGNTAYKNVSTGILTSGSGVTISGNSAYENGGTGINSGTGSTISGNATYNNGGDGIHGGPYSTIAENTASNNVGDGIDANTGCHVRGNTVGSNDGFGLDLSLNPPMPAYRENVINGNVMGSVDGGVNMGSNSCNGTTTCP